MTTVRPLLAAILAVGAIALAGCATTPGGTPAPTTTTVPSDQRLEEAQAAPPEGPVTGTGTVLDTAGEAQLCLGPIMESFPPQCQGVPLDGWSWEGLDGSESSGDTTWGAYAVTGTYDGTRFTRTEAPVLLALYDPAAPEDPTGGVAGTTGADELDRVQNDVVGRLGPEALSAAADRGYVWVQVVWDDGMLQSAMDAEYGAGVVVVTSALRERG